MFKTKVITLFFCAAAYFENCSAFDFDQYYEILANQGMVQQHHYWSDQENPIRALLMVLTGGHNEETDRQKRQMAKLLNYYQAHLYEFKRDLQDSYIDSPRMSGRYGSTGYTEFCINLYKIFYETFANTLKMDLLKVTKPNTTAHAHFIKIHQCFVTLIYGLPLLTLPRNWHFESNLAALIEHSLSLIHAILSQNTTSQTVDHIRQVQKAFLTSIHTTIHQNAKLAFPEEKPENNSLDPFAKVLWHFEQTLQDNLKLLETTAFVQTKLDPMGYRWENFPPINLL